jgi:hypothetical protein
MRPGEAVQRDVHYRSLCAIREAITLVKYDGFASVPNMDLANPENQEPIPSALRSLPLEPLPPVETLRQTKNPR